MLGIEHHPRKKHALKKVLPGYRPIRIKKWVDSESVIWDIICVEAGWSGLLAEKEIVMPSMDISYGRPRKVFDREASKRRSWERLKREARHAGR